jgi:hypothetical protein
VTKVIQTPTRTVQVFVVWLYSQHTITDAHGYSSRLSDQSPVWSEDPGIQHNFWRTTEWSLTCIVAGVFTISKDPAWRHPSPSVELWSKFCLPRERPTSDGAKRRPVAGRLGPNTITISDVINDAVRLRQADSMYILPELQVNNTLIIWWISRH